MAATSQRREKFENYDGFVEKFKPKKTTDDCYTPPNIYNAVTDWVANEYNLDKSEFVRPFYPPELITLAKIYSFSEYGIEFVIPHSESVRISALDAQRPFKKTIFGTGWLVSERLKAERLKAVKWYEWELSAREKEIVASLTTKESSNS